MIKHVGIFILLFFIVYGGIAANNNESLIETASPAVRNSLKFNSSQLSGETIDEGSNKSDDFNLPVLRSHWITESENQLWSLRERPGFLRIKSQENTGTSNVSTTFSQKLDNSIHGEALIYVDLANMQNGDEVGMFLSNVRMNCIVVKMVKNQKILKTFIGNEEVEGPSITSNVLIFKSNIEPSNATFSFSYDGLNFNLLGSACTLNSLGEKTVGLFYQGQNQSISGTVDVDWFYFKNISDTKAQFAELDK